MKAIETTGLLRVRQRYRWVIYEGSSMMNRFKGTATQALIGTTVAFFFGFAAVSIFGPTVKEFSRVIPMDPMMIALLVAMPSLSGSLLRIPFGAWGDSGGGRKPILLSLSLSLVGIAGLLLLIVLRYPANLTAAYYPVLLVLGLLAGCGIVVFAPGVGQVSYWFPQQRQGTALGVFGGVGNMAAGIFALALPMAIAALGLANSYLAWLGFLVTGIVVYYLIGANAQYFQFKRKGLSSNEAKRKAAEQGQTLFPAGTAKQSLALAARNWKTWALVGVYFTSFGGFVALTSWLPTFWTKLYGVDIVTAGILTGTFSILVAVMRTVGGPVSDRVGGERAATTAIVVMVLGSAVVTVSNLLLISLAGVVILAVGMGIANAAVFKIIPQQIKGAVGGAAGWIGGIGAFGGFVIPPVLGVFASAQGLAGYTSGFVVFIGLSFLSLGLIGVLRRTKMAGRAVEIETTGQRAAA
jgi:MFS transporter, NNP family, nitrate/nitrite transporter